jgi:Spy/CpxP family protein refolding chaperone
MKRTIATLGLTIILILGLFGLGQVYAQNKEEGIPCPNCPGNQMMEDPPMMGGPGMMMDSMGLTMEQQKSMLEKRMQLHKDIAPLKTDLETKEMELQAMWFDEKPDVEKIVKKLSDINKVKWQIQEKEIRNQFEIYKMLKPAQQMMFRRRHMMGMGQGGMMMSPMMNQPMSPMMCPMMNQMGGMGGCCQ